MKKLLTLIIALLALFSLTGKSTANPIETTVIEPLNAVFIAVKEEPPEVENPPAKPLVAVTEESRTKTTEPESVIVETETSEPPVVEAIEAKQEPTPPTETPPAETENHKSNGIVIGDPSPEQTYSCGTDGHHCTGPDTHSFICELEQKGCEYCGSRNCPSFYAVDEWRQGCYTPSECPKYDIHADPVYYCQRCGKPCGDGRNGTCAEYNIDLDCPNCGEQVKAWTCHSCE